MAGKCEICGKTSASGYNVSHSKRHTKRIWAPNVHRQTILVGGVPTRAWVCTRCLRTLQKTAR
ncbi:MAG: 50S ribosomal protein L28 [Chloroflexota bacterium]